MLSKQFLRFGMVGVLGFIVDATVLHIFLIWLDPFTARLISFAAAVTTTWLANRHFTFDDRGPPFRQWLRFVAVNGIGGMINYATYGSVVLADYAPFWGLVAGSLAGMLWNFSMSRRFVFAAS